MENVYLYWFLRYFLLAVLIYSGWCITYRKDAESNFWYYSIPSIFAYSLIQGLRWNRGVDYPHYYQDLTGLLYRDYSEFIYKWWLDLFKMSHFPFWAAFVFYSAILIVSFLFLIKRFPKSAIWALPLFFIITVRYSENLIRQYFALPFVFLALVAYFDRKYIKMVVMAFVAFFIHYSMVIPFSLIILSFLLSHIKLSSFPYVQITIFLFFFFYWDSQYFSFVAKYISYIDIEETTGFSQYTFQADEWWTDSGRLSVAHGVVYKGVSIFTEIIKFCLYIFVIICGNKVFNENNNRRMIFWLSYFAIILDVIKEDIEMYIRVYSAIAFILPIVYGEIYANLKLNDIVKYVSWGGVFLLYFYLNIIRQMFVLDFAGYAFIWDR